MAIAAERLARIGTFTPDEVTRRNDDEESIIFGQVHLSPYEV